MESRSDLPSDLLAALTLVYQPCGWTCNKIVKEAESLEYGAYRFEINNKSILFRVAKITPTKVGQFVTLWKRVDKGPIAPFDVNDPIDIFVISVRNQDHFGQFVFPKAVLVEKGVITDSKEGKRAIRVYPPWDIADNPQAKKTQKWQLPYFFKIPKSDPVNLSEVQRLYR